MQGPLFDDGTFEFVPIPESEEGDLYRHSRNYGNTPGRYGTSLIEHFPPARRKKMKAWSLHDDPEFETFTYGDPTVPKRSLRSLERGDLRVFYCGLKKGGKPPALYIIGYFEILKAGFAENFTLEELAKHFPQNAHVRNPDRFEHEKKKKLVLIKDDPPKRRLLRKAVLISELGKDRSGRTLTILWRERRTIFGEFGGLNSIQRSTPRWVRPEFVERAAEFEQFFLALQFRFFLFPPVQFDTHLPTQRF